MPQPPNASSSTAPPAQDGAPAAAERAPAKPKATAAKPKTAAAAKPKTAAAAKPKTATAAKPKTATAAKPKTATAAKPKTATAAKPKTATAAKPKASTAKPRATKATADGEGAAQRGGADDPKKAKPRIEIHVNADAPQLELLAERLRKLNERIIELGREAGESRLASYEKTLKAIAGNLSQGPGKDEIEWITQLATSQAKFVRELTDSWAKAARDRFK